jgi:outer membrane lipoprotein SlyB
VGAVAGAIAGVAGLGTAITNYKTTREQIKADERMYRMQMLQSKQDAASSSQMVKVGLVQAKQQADAQAKIAKTVVTGIGAVAVLGGLLWIGKDLLKD